MAIWQSNHKKNALEDDDDVPFTRHRKLFLYIGSNIGVFMDDNIRRAGMRRRVDW